MSGPVAGGHGTPQGNAPTVPPGPHAPYSRCSTCRTASRPEPPPRRTRRTHGRTPGRQPLDMTAPFPTRAWIPVNVFEQEGTGNRRAGGGHEEASTRKRSHGDRGLLGESGGGQGRQRHGTGAAASTEAQTRTRGPAGGARGAQGVAGTVTALGRPGRSEIAELLTSELVTNALIHTDDDAVLTATVGPRGLRVEVRDFVARRPRLHVPDADDGTHGRGLVLVQSLADSWESRPTGWASPSGSSWSRTRCERRAGHGMSNGAGAASSWTPPPPRLSPGPGSRVTALRLSRTAAPGP